MCFSSWKARVKSLKKWKRRFFVLFKPSGSLPGQYELNYYNDEVCTKKKGTIDLEQCEQIIESLDSEQFPYLLAIKTVCRGKDRTYFLSADSEEEMTSWVRNLCSVCELKQEDNPTDIPEPKKNHPVTDSSVTGLRNDTPNGNLQTSTTPHHVTTTQPGSSSRSQSKRALHSPTSPSNPPSSPSYIPVWESNSGSQKKKQPPSFERSVSVDSVPEEMAPPPPVKTGHMKHDSNDNDVGNDSVFSYDFPPPKKNTVAPDLNKVPPSRTIDFTDSKDQCYDVPPHSDGPARPPHVPLSSTSLAYDTPPPRHKHDIQQPYDIAPHVPQPYDVVTPRIQKTGKTPPQTRTMPQTQAYDIPPPRVPRGSPNCKTHVPKTEGQTTPPQSTYDTLPPTDDNLVIPPRPPKPHLPSAYQNIPPGSKTFDGMDLSAVPAAPKSLEKPLLLDSYDIPKSSNQTSETLDLSSVAPAPKPCTPLNIHPYINAASGVIQPGYIAMDGDQEEVYTDMSVLRLPPGSEFGPPLDPTYSDMNHPNGMSPAACKGPRVSSSSPRPITASNPESDTYLNQIWSSQRTKSFKRHDERNKIKDTSLRQPIPVVTAKSPMPPRRDTFSSSDDEDEDGCNGVHIPKQMRAVPPPPPGSGEDRELKYLDLALDEYTQEPQAKQPTTGHVPHSTPTEYREIDFVKTQALSNTKKWKDGQMKMA